MAKRKKRITYHDDFRAEVVTALISAGYPQVKGALTRVAKDYGLHARTIQRWANGENNAPPDNIVTEKRKDLAELIENEIYSILDLMPEKRAQAKYPQLAVAFGIFYDKFRLLKGLPTEILGVLPDFISAANGANIPPSDALNEYIKVLHEQAQKVDAE